MDFLAADDELLAWEHEKYQAGFRFVAGIDEVGRGPLAGPVVAAAVAFPVDARIPRVNDSKKLREEKREFLYYFSRIKYQFDFLIHCFLITHL